jgi:transposase
VQVEGIENFQLVGTDTLEVLERRPASCVVVALHYKKFLREGRDRAAEATEVLVAPAAELPIERGTAGPSLLADTIVRRWQDHQPLNRLEDIYRREQLGLAKSTMCTWHEQLAELVHPLVDATTFVSLLASARLHDIQPHGYIRDLLCLIRTWPPDRLLELAPVNWKQTLEQTETQQ